MKYRLRLLGATVLLAGAGCLGAVPYGHITRAESAVRAARTLGAETHPPRAVLHLHFAQEQIEQARALVADGDMKRAVGMLLRAEADAELAVELAHQAEAEAAAQAAREALEAEHAAHEPARVDGPVRPSDSP